MSYLANNNPMATCPEGTCEMSEAFLYEELKMMKGNGGPCTSISKDRLGVYELVAGNLDYLERRFILDWRRALGVHMWCEFAGPLQTLHFQRKLSSPWSHLY